MPEEKLDRAKIQAEMEALQLEKMREDVRTIRSTREARKARTLALQNSLRDTTLRQKLIQSRCAHRKGGKGVGMLFSGNDANYAVVKFTLSHGPTIVVCQRCIRLWEPPDRKLVRRGASPEERAEYKRQMDEYQWAMNLPTDNEPGGTKLFEIYRDDAA
jgi:hypothetical protein